MSKTRVCPRCGKMYTDPPALSRHDNKTEICPDCGLGQAVATMILHSFKARNKQAGAGEEMGRLAPPLEGK